MGVEIDFLAVGEESKSGDAIALRYGDLNGSRADQVVIVVDGGYSDDGDKVVNFVRGYYKTDTVDVVLSTHPDQDHIGGLPTVISNLGVKQLWMHQPWKHSASFDVAKAVGFGYLRLAERLEKSFEESVSLEKLAGRLGIPIVEPFAGLTSPDGNFMILGPTQTFYTELLSEIKPPAEATSVKELLRKAAEAVGAVVSYVTESFDIETLTDDGETSPQNESSAVSYLRWDGRSVLLTADVGLRGLNHVANVLEANGVAPGLLALFQVPHHGSQRNAGPTILNRLLGPKDKNATRGHAFISAATNGKPKHPNKKVTNAMHRRGYSPYVTGGRNTWHHHIAPPRDTYSTADPEPFHHQVEEAD